MLYMSKKLAAEFLGTAWLVLGGCGTAVLAGHGVGWLGVSLAFGLTVLTMAFAIGHISGCHLNPAVTLGLVAGKRFPAKEAGGYIAAQVLGAIAGAGILYVIASQLEPSTKLAFDPHNGFASNMWGATLYGDKAHYTMVAALVIEVVMTFFFLFVIMGATHAKAPAGFAPIAIGLCLTLIHLISIPVTNTSVNPARSISQAIFAGGAAVSQVWLFIVGPIVGGVLGGVVYAWLGSSDPARVAVDG
jgi:aquaporin Z